MRSPGSRTWRKRLPATALQRRGRADPRLGAVVGDGQVLLEPDAVPAHRDGERLPRRRRVVTLDGRCPAGPLRAGQELLGRRARMGARGLAQEGDVDQGNVVDLGGEPEPPGVLGRGALGHGQRDDAAELGAEARPEEIDGPPGGDRADGGLVIDQVVRGRPVQGVEPAAAVGRGREVSLRQALRLVDADRPRLVAHRVRPQQPVVAERPDAIADQRLGGIRSSGRLDQRRAGSRSGSRRGAGRRRGGGAGSGLGLGSGTRVGFGVRTGSTRMRREGPGSSIAVGISTPS